jgi:hypothetical protein
LLNLPNIKYYHLHQFPQGFLNLNLYLIQTKNSLKKNFLCNFSLLD